jgi:hypothetical protein
MLAAPAGLLAGPLDLFAAGVQGNLVEERIVTVA